MDHRNDYRGDRRCSAHHPCGSIRLADPSHSTPAAPPASVATANAKSAAGVLMASYDPEKALWPSSWWNSAVALQTIEHYMLRTGDRSYRSQVDNTFEEDNAAFPNARDWRTQASALSAVVPARHGR